MMMKHLETKVNGEGNSHLCALSIISFFFFFSHGIWYNPKLPYVLLVSVLIWNTFHLPLFGHKPNEIFYQYPLQVRHSYPPLYFKWTST